MAFPLQSSVLIQRSRERSLTSAHPISVAVIGVGAFGRNHARVYHELQQQGGVRLAAIVDAAAAGERVQELARQFACPAYECIPALLASGTAVQAASVAVPTVHHLAAARALMEAGVDVLIEKPVAVTLAEADELIALAAGRQRIAMVGHLERFNPAVRATAPLITQPLFFEIHRLSLFSPRALDVDVVLDLMIHDLDIVLSFVDSPVKEVHAVGLPILSDKVDIANVRVEFENGCVANFTASRVSTERVRKVRFFQPHQYVSIDYAKQDAFTLTVDAAAMGRMTAAPDGTAPAAPVAGASPLDALPGFASAIRMARPQVQAEEPLRAELREFLEAVRTRRRPLVPLEDGRRALALALEINAAIATHAKALGLGT